MMSFPTAMDFERYRVLQIRFTELHPSIRSRVHAALIAPEIAPSTKAEIQSIMFGVIDPSIKARFLEPILAQTERERERTLATAAWPAGHLAQEDLAVRASQFPTAMSSPLHYDLSIPPSILQQLGCISP